MRHVSGTVTIGLIEGQGIWLTLRGPFVDGSMDRVAERLDQLADLAFTIVILDVSDVPLIDHSGTSLLKRFIRGIDISGGAVHAIDPTQLLRDFLDPTTPGFTASMTAPVGPWWIT